MSILKIVQQDEDLIEEDEEEELGFTEEDLEEGEDLEEEEGLGEEESFDFSDDEEE